MKEKTDMEQNKYIEVTIELGDSIKPHVWTSQNGQKMLTFQVAPRKNGADERGRTHNASIRYKAVDGNYYTQYIGSGKEKTFGGGASQGPLPAPAPRQASVPAQGASGAAAAMATSQQVTPQSSPAPSPSSEDLPF